MRRSDGLFSTKEGTASAGSLQKENGTVCYVNNSQVTLLSNNENTSLRSTDISNKTYFESADTHKLFNPLHNETVVDSNNRRIKILSCIIEKEEGIDQYVNYAKDHPLTQQQLQNLTQQCMVLRACYYCALRDMRIVQN